MLEYNICMVFTVVYYPNSYPSISVIETTPIKDHLLVEWSVVFFEKFHYTLVNDVLVAYSVLSAVFYSNFTSINGKETENCCKANPYTARPRN
jgi:hypothetical protein